MIKFLVSSIFMIILCTSAMAGTTNLYQVTLLRASAGQLPQLIEEVKQQKTQNKQGMLIMRHSQGDHWDLMLLKPTADELPTQTSYQQYVDFQHDFLANSLADWDSVLASAKGADLFHIEMFQAVNGAYEGLLEQRQMENNYLEATQRKANLIFETVFGSDVDLFTLGIYPDLQAFAADPNLTEAVFEKAATDAGFKSRSDIGFYLREFLVGHQDTLATQVRATQLE